MGLVDGNTTNDKIFLFSATEAKNYFNTESMVPSGMGRSTAYAQAQSEYDEIWVQTQDHSFCWWWLRSSGSDNRSYAATYSIFCYERGRYVGDLCGVRPALWITLDT